jgi:hypothetical protein
MTLAKYVAVFIVLTVLLFELFRLVGGWMAPMQRYREPEGKAVKVFSQDRLGNPQSSMLDRLRLFYWYGE